MEMELMSATHNFGIQSSKMWQIVEEHIDESNKYWMLDGYFMKLS